MARGRKRQPPELHVIKGTFRPDRHGTGETPRSDERPTAPQSLDERERERFAELVKRLDEIGIASASHERVISLAAKRMVEIEDCDAAIAKYGHVYESVDDQGRMLVKPNPAVRMRSDAMRHLQALMAELGLTPASAGKVGAKKSNEKRNAFAEALTD